MARWKVRMHLDYEYGNIEADSADEAYRIATEYAVEDGVIFHEEELVEYGKGTESEG